MSKVSKEVIEEVEYYVGKLDYDLKRKCISCDSVLVDVVDSLKAMVNAPTNTIYRVLTNSINCDVGRGDEISCQYLRNRCIRAKHKLALLNCEKRCIELENKVDELTNIIVEYVDKESSDM